MFTGIIEHLGTLTTITHGDRDSILVVDLGPLADGTKLGDSIATNGICLTVAKLDGTQAEFLASAETRRKTTLGGWRSGQVVNLEGASDRFTFVCPDGDTVKTVEKGSVAVDGISLTSWDCRGARFSVAVIPHTLAHTTLGGLRPGATVNLEQDVIGRWVERMLPGR